MYLQTPCNEPNSLSPISPAAIASTDALLQSVDDAMTGGNAALNDLISALFGNASGSDLPGAAGVPTGNVPVAVPSSTSPATGSGAPGAAASSPGTQIAWQPKPGVSNLFPQWAYGPSSGFIPVRQFGRCGRPAVVPLSTSLPVQSGGYVSTVVQPPAAPVVAAPAAPVAPAAIPECSVTPDSICYAIRSGCVLPSQVTLDQILACSKAGYAGNTMEYPALAARGGAQNGKYFGSMNLNPAPFNPGLGDDPISAPSSASWLLPIAGIVGLAGVFWWVTKK